MTKTRFLLALLAVLLCHSLLLFAAEDKKPLCEFKVAADKTDAIYKKGENVRFQIQLVQAKDKKPLTGEKFYYTVRGDGGFEKKGELISAEEPVTVDARLDRPGMLYCTLSWTSQDKQEKAQGAAGAAVDPLEIKAARPEPRDFDEFWKKKLAEAEKLPMNVKLVPFQPEKYKDQGVEVYDIKVDCMGKAPVSGYLVKPIGAKPKSLPIVVNYHGAGVRSASIPVGDAKHGTLALDINAHGLENGQPDKFYNDLANGDLKNYRIEGGNDREKCYFLGMFLRVARSLQFMKSLPEWDGKNIGVKGTSQGGGQSLVAAGLDPQVTVCAAYVPAICYHTGYVDKEFGGWPGFLRPSDKPFDEAVIANVPYFDAAIFAKRIKAPCFLSTGFIDYTCSPTSVYVAYNNIKTPKRIVTTPEATHQVPKSTYDEGNKWFWEELDKNRVSNP